MEDAGRTWTGNMVGSQSSWGETATWVDVDFSSFPAFVGASSVTEVPLGFLCGVETAEGCGGGCPSKCL
jgi:hypothetical protein